MSRCLVVEPFPDMSTGGGERARHQFCRLENPGPGTANPMGGGSWCSKLNEIKDQDI